MNSTTPDEDRQTPPPASPFAECVGDFDSAQAPLSFATLRLPWAAGLLVLLLCGLMNAGAVPFAESISGPLEGIVAILLAMGVGAIGGQIGGLSATLVWAPGAFFIRQLVLWVIGTALFGCWFGGLMISMLIGTWYEHRLGIAGSIAAGLPLISLAVQLPQWLARFYFSWRIEPPGGAASSAPAGLAIRDLLVGTVVVALTITALQLSPAAADIDDNFFWFAWGISVSVIAVISSLVMLPLLVLIFRFHPLWGLLFIALASPLIVGATIYAITLLEPGGGGPDAQAILMFLIAGTTCVAVTSIPLWLARWAGYRLKFGRDMP